MQRLASHCVLRSGLMRPAKSKFVSSRYYTTIYNVNFNMHLHTTMYSNCLIPSYPFDTLLNPLPGDIVQKSPVEVAIGERAEGSGTEVCFYVDWVNDDRVPTKLQTCLPIWYVLQPTQRSTTVTRIVFPPHLTSIFWPQTGLPSTIGGDNAEISADWS